MGLPSLPTSLLPAMWRYIPFEAREIGRETGRRLVTHEYPNRDEPYNEDMGRKARRWKLQGFVLGEGAPAIRDLMIAACEKEGPGPLLHPTLGLVNARCESLSVKESLDAGVNVVEFTFDFIEAGSVYSIGTIMTVVALAKSAAVTIACAVLYASRQKSEGQPHDVRARAVKDQTDRAATLSLLSGKFSDRTGAEAFNTAVNGITKDAASLAGDPQSGASAWQTAFASITNAADLCMIASALKPLFDESQIAASGIETGTVATIKANTANLDMLLYVSALSVAGNAAANDTYTTWDDAIGIRGQIAAWLDSAALWIADAALHAAILDLKGVVVQAISDEAMTLPRLRNLTVPLPIPALTLAFDLYGDADRAMEIVTRNNLSDPSAVAGNLRVLTV
jgi:prophage DNA circulation protein